MTSKPHHHGNLREALIRAAIDIIETGGPDALTLRKCAALAGVSHAAPAHHFKGVFGLKAAVIAHGHQLFAATMNRHCKQAAPLPHDQLNAIAQGYIAFAREHDALFKFMFQPHDYSPDMVDETTATEIGTASLASYSMLRDACAPFSHPSGNGVAIETMVWSLVHGYALLFSKSDGVGPAQEPIPEITDILPPLTLKPIP